MEMEKKIEQIKKILKEKFDQVKSLLDADTDSFILALGDYLEYTESEPLFAGPILKGNSKLGHDFWVNKARLSGVQADASELKSRSKAQEKISQEALDKEAKAYRTQNTSEMQKASAVYLGEPPPLYNNLPSYGIDFRRLLMKYATKYHDAILEYLNQLGQVELPMFSWYGIEIEKNGKTNLTKPKRIDTKGMPYKVFAAFGASKAYPPMIGFSQFKEGKEKVKQTVRDIRRQNPRGLNIFQPIEGVGYQLQQLKQVKGT